MPPLALPQPWVRFLLLPAHERLRGRRTLADLAALRRGERDDPQTAHALREQKLAALLQHCVERVPWYRDRCGVTEPVLARFPVLERATVRDHGDALKSDGFDGELLRSSTGGSSGAPLVFWTDKVKEARHNAQKLRFRRWFGIRPGDRQVDFWGSPIELGKQSRLRVAKDRYLLNQVVLSAHDLTPERLQEYARFLARFRPRLLYGYPTVIYRLAQFVDAHPELLGRYRPVAVVCTSEMLYPQMREAIAAVFECPVANEYGSRDGGLIAHECSEGRLHVAMEHVWLEVDAPDENGVGDLLVTNLDGYGMPFVRYRVGDRGRLGEPGCACGFHLPVLDHLEGRRNDFLVGVDGRQVHGSAANYVMRELERLHQYRLIQRRDLSVDVDVVMEGELTDDERQTVHRGLRRALGGDVPVRLRRVGHIPPSASGKYRWVESEALTQ
ncbi:phenylacetate-CoA ligase [Aquisalimonas asiatica]|uniref:Phenylacetate-CoA ligase n=2 Tax=Aquisalimonas asiatica TaxID=406100 RepID=A0A1H8U3H9_9GAMM|nr:phenylacetate--CoA ligase family protein [Aquisalimonas asiatica]SEO97830.1 phenylacetate-CoA ligase [Aquisalimonas asiatica]